MVSVVYVGIDLPIAHLTHPEGERWADERDAAYQCNNYGIDNGRVRKVNFVP